MKIGGNHAFFRDTCNNASILETKNAIHCFVVYCFLDYIPLNYLQKMHGYLQLSFWVSVAFAKICFSRIR